MKYYFIKTGVYLFITAFHLKFEMAAFSGHVMVCPDRPRSLQFFFCSPFNIHLCPPVREANTNENFLQLTDLEKVSLVSFAGSISTADGSALVKIGNTTVICGIKAVSSIL